MCVLSGKKKLNEPRECLFKGLHNYWPRGCGWCTPWICHGSHSSSSCLFTKILDLKQNIYFKWPKVKLHEFLWLLDQPLLRTSIKCEITHFLPLTIPDNLNDLFLRVYNQWWPTLKPIFSWEEVFTNLTHRPLYTQEGYQKPLLDWIGIKPTRFNFVPWSKAVVQLQTCNLE